MKKYLLIISLFVLLSCDSSNPYTQPKQNVAVQTATITPKSNEITDEDIRFLSSVGMGSSVTVKERQNALKAIDAQKLSKKLGLPVMSDNDMIQNLKKSGLVIAPIERFLGNIPIENIKEFKENLNSLYTKYPNLHTGYQIKTTYTEGERFLRNLRRDEWEKFNLTQTALIETKRVRELIPDFEYDDYHRVLFHWNNGVPIEIIAPMEEINMEGLLFNDEQARYFNPIARDPAVIIHLPDGWVILTAWK